MPPMHFEYLFTILGLLTIGLLLAILIFKTRQQVKETSLRERQAAVLFQLSNDLVASDSLDEILTVIRSKVGQIFDCYVGIFLWSDGKVERSSLDAGFPTSESGYENEWALNERRVNFPEAYAHYAPLRTSQRVFGVLGIAFKGKKLGQDLKDKHLLIALANQAAMAIQRAKLAEVSRQVELMHEREKLQTALLNSISHDFRTPLVSIMGVLNNLLQDYDSLDAKSRQELLANAYEDSDHLNRLVGNLLDMTRLEAKALKTKIEPCELRDVIGVSLQSLKNAEHRNIDIKIPSEFPEIPLDFVLMMRVFVNIIDNAVKYSSVGTAIEITAQTLHNKVKIDIRDQGIGIPKEDLVKIFDKFYRAFKPRQVSGTGLGLSICKGIVEAHGGRIFAENNSDQGVTISIILPLAQKEMLVHG